MQLRTILHPTDFSEPAREALRYAVEMAHASGAKLVILHAVETLGPENVTYGEAVALPQPDAYRERLWQDLRQMQIPEPRPRLEYLLSDEHPVTAILRTAAEHDCDLIVIGNHGRHGLRRFFEGSVAEQVVRGAACPVLVVKAPEKPKPSTPEKAVVAESPH